VRDATRPGTPTVIFKPVKQSELLAAIVLALTKTISAGNSRRTNPCVNRDEGAHPLNILLAEDNPVNQRLATRLLEKNGHTVMAVKDGRAAVAAVESNSFDLALLDVQMPIMDGLQAAGLIRQREQLMGTSRLPLIALTAHAMTGDRELCLAAEWTNTFRNPSIPKNSSK